MLSSHIKKNISGCYDGHTFSFHDLLIQYVQNDIPEAFFLKRFDSKVVVVGVRFDDSCIFVRFYLLGSHIKNCNSGCDDGCTF